MTTQQLGSILRCMYLTENANKITMVLLFGIKYAAEIKQAAANSSLSAVVNEIIAFSELPKSLATEIKKGVALADFVEEKQIKNKP